MKASVLRYAAIGMASLSLAGFAAASTVTVTGSGPDSHNRVDLENRLHVNSHNVNALGVTNFSAQGAASGDVDVKKNTEAGSASSGNAMNGNVTTTSAVVTNTGSAAALAALAGLGSGDTNVTLVGSGPGSHNNVDVDNTAHINLSNTNVVNVNNLNLQSAQSGNVKADRNTSVGSVTSGNASNQNTTTTTVEISN